MKSFLPDKLYDILSWIALVALDLIGVAYEQLADIWSLPYGTAVMRTCAVLSALLGGMIGVSKIQYSNSKKKEK